MLPSLPWFLWKANMSWKGKSQMISLFKTKIGLSSSVNLSLARANGPAEKMEECLKRKRKETKTNTTVVPHPKEQNGRNKVR